MSFTNAQLQTLWVQNGGNPAAAPMAAAIALAESGGDPNATNHNTDQSTDRGLWQINSVHGAQSTYDIVANVKAAISISNNGATWGPWSTFNNGAFQRFLTGRARARVPSSSPPAGVTPTGSMDLFGQHHTELLYAAVWIGAVVLALYLLYTGLDRTTHGTVRASTHRVGRAAAVAA